MKHIEHFKNFLRDEVNLNTTRLDRLDDRVGSIESFLKKDSTFKDYFSDLVPQGSYAHKTIIKPVKSNQGFDADVLLEMTPPDGWTPKDYVEKLYTAFRGSSTYKEMVCRKTRCVMIDYADDFHIDIVPFVTIDGQTKITNRHEDKYEGVNPEGFTTWFKEKNKLTGGHLLKVMRLLKFIRDFKQTFSVRSFVLNALVGERVSVYDNVIESGCYADVPTALRTITKNLDAYLQNYPTMPAIYDPSNLTDDLSKRWDQDKYANFRNKINFYAKKIEEAYKEADSAKSLTLWREVFGDDFGKVAVVKFASTLAAFHRPPDAPLGEMFLQEQGIEVVPNAAFELRIDGFVKPVDGWRAYRLSEGNQRVLRERKIEFSIEKCNVPEPYEVKWKVRNRGAEAIAAFTLRGEIRGDYGRRTISEPTRYKGNHYVECYIIKDGVCVISKRISVNIVDRL